MDPGPSSAIASPSTATNSAGTVGPKINGTGSTQE